MLRIFLPLYFLLFIFSFFSGEYFEELLVRIAPEAAVDDTVGDLSGAFYMIEKVLHLTPEEYWTDELKHMSSVNIPVQLVNIRDLNLTEEGISHLRQGEIWVADLKEGISLKAFGEQGRLIQIGPVDTTDLYNSYAYWTLFGGSTALIVCMVLWSLTVQRRIRHLTKVTQQFGEGDLSVRSSEAGHLKVSNLNKNFNHMAERIEQLIESHKHLSSAVSHELRTPISRIKFELDFAQGLNDVSDLHASLNSIAEDVGELEELVSEALTYARFERSGLQLELAEEDLAAWLVSWKAQIKQTLFHLNVSVSVPERSCLVQCHLPSIKRALDNLVLNASRYALHTIDVTLEDLGHEVCLTVDDDGTGIPEEQWATLFDPFVRADKSRSKQTGGFGLGLAIVQQIMQRHQGKVEVMNSPLGGARFQLRCPKCRAHNER
jgi:two-component system, OmpR family, sensor histidine kinase RstB